MEFQAVIMAAGKGSRMTDLTSSCPKALLPVGNFPMIWYPINLLERSGFEEAIVIVLESFAAEAQRVLCNVCQVTMQLDFVSIPDNEFWGSADSLRHIKDKIKTDVLVISCDLICGPEVSLFQLANMHRTHDASLTMFLSGVTDQYSEVPAPGFKSKKRAERDFIGLDEKGQRVLFLSAEADLEDSVTFRKAVLKKHPFVNIHSRMTDCHLYLMKKWIIQFLCEKENISTIKGELLPYLVRKQFSKLKPQNKEDKPQNNEYVNSAEMKTDMHDYTQEEPMTGTVQDLSTWMGCDGDMAQCYQGEEIRCYACIQNNGFCVRANTLGTFCEANRQIPRFLGNLVPEKKITPVHSSATIKEKSQVGTDCLLGEGVTVGERVSIKKSIVGKQCSIADRVKITNSVIMDHVTIQEGCNIQGSILCSRAVISEKCDLKDCMVGHAQNLVPMGKFANEAIIEVDRMMEI